MVRTTIHQASRRAIGFGRRQHDDGSTDIAGSGKRGSSRAVVWVWLFQAVMNPSPESIGILIVVVVLILVVTLVFRRLLKTS